MSIPRSRGLRLRLLRLMGSLCLAARTLAVEPAVDASQMPRVKPLEPSAAARSFQVRAGFRAELVAAEPLVTSPVAVTVDENGGLFVVEMRDYSERRPEQLGRVRRLTSTAGDGRYDRADVFLGGLPWPTAIACWDGGVFIGATPDIIYAKDTDGDGVADIHEVVFTGFASQYAPYATNKLNVQALLNSFLWGMDHRIHGAASMSGGEVRLVDSEFTRRWRTRYSAIGPAPVDPVLLSSGSGFSFDPRTLEFRAETGGGQHGMTFDDAGNKYVCSNSDHLQQVLYDGGEHVGIAADGPAAEVFRISPDEPWRVLRTRWRVAGLVEGMIEGGGRPSGYFTGATGVTVYRGDAWPEEYRGDVFVADCGSNLVHRKKLHSIPGRVRREGVRAEDETKSEFLASTDNWFRPVQFFNAPDGCLWVIDMYRETIEHPWSLPVGLKRQLDLDSGRDRGRLWRLRPESGPALRATQRLAGLKPEDYVRLLSHPNAWHRETAARLLHERGARTGISELRSLFRSSTNQVARLQALGVIHGLGALDDTLLAAAVRDPVSEVRAQALRWVHQSDRESAAPLQSVLQDAAREETDEGARLELAFVLSKNATGGRVRPVADLIRRQSDLAQSVASGLLPGSPLLFLELMGPAGDRPLRPEFPGASDVLQRLTRTLADRGGEGALSALRDRLPRLADPVLAVRLSATALEANWGRSLLPALAPVIAQARAIVAKGEGEKGFADSVVLLSQTPWDASQGALLPLLEAAQSETVQRAGVEAIGRQRKFEALAALTNAFPHLKPGARQRAVAVLITRPEGARAALEATRAGLLTARDWTVPQMASMRRHKDDAIRLLAEREFGSAPANRQAVVDQFVPALSLQGDAARGGAIFEERCSSCHQFKGKGKTLGPDLASVVSNGPEKLLVSILDPNREVAPNFVAWTVETKDGESSTGLLGSDDAAGVLLRLAGGLEARVPRDRVARLKPEGRSLMPEGLESGLASQQMADLIAHLLGSSAR